VPGGQGPVPTAKTVRRLRCPRGRFVTCRPVSNRLCGRTCGGQSSRSGPGSPLKSFRPPPWVHGVPRGVRRLAQGRRRRGWCPGSGRVPVRAIRREERGMTVRAGGEALSAATVIGADGANSLVAKQFLPSRPPARYMALEAEVPQDGHPLGERFSLTWGPTPAGTPGHFQRGSRQRRRDGGVPRGSEASPAFAAFVGQSARTTCGRRG